MEHFENHGMSGVMDRRTFLRGTAAVPLLYGATAVAALADEPREAARGPERSAFPGMILRQREPLNLEFPFPTLGGFLTPNERFYVRNHFPIPKLDAKTWRLKVEGAVERPLELTYEDVIKMASHSRTALLECAGNGRVFLTPSAAGVQWELGAVGNAEWTGVPLARILEKAGLRDAAVEVVLEGADEGEVKDEPKSPGPIRFARSLPLEKARRPEVLLAHRMNGKELPLAHGFPLRAIVPGWYGMASVKWLTRVLVTDRPFRGFWQTLGYSYFERREGLPSVQPVTEMLVKSEIARPARNEVVSAGISYLVHGAAWAGESEVTRVEVSTDGGEHWGEARLLEKPAVYSWRLWEYEWRTPARAGACTLMARATDKRGRTQPPRHDPDRRAYMINFTFPVPVEVC